MKNLLNKILDWLLIDWPVLEEAVKWYDLDAPKIPWGENLPY